MLATIKSLHSAAHFRRLFGPVFVLLFLFGLRDFTQNINGQPAAQTDSRGRAAQVFQTAQMRYQREMNQPEAAWLFSRACFDWAEFATNGAQRAEIAELGIAAGRLAVARAPKLAAGHYYLAMNLGQLAQTKKMSALKIIDEIEREFKAARDLDGGFDFAGPERSLGLLYLDAPGWPVSVGNRTKARQHLQKAVELSPDFPDNQLSLLEAYLKWGEKKTVRDQLASVEATLAAARKKFAADAWAASWEDWNRRWEKIRSKVTDNPKPIESPKNQR